jgi:flagellar biogenesis protein FliO
MDSIQVALSLAGVILIIIGCYYTTYYIGLKASGQSRARGAARARGRGRNINLHERFAVSRDKGFCIIEVAGKIYLIGMTNQSMTVIDTLDPSELASPPGKPSAGKSMATAYAGQFGGKLTKRLAAFMAQRMGMEHGAGDGDRTGAGTGSKTEIEIERAIEPEPEPETGAGTVSGNGEAGASGRFADSMESARKKGTSGQPGSTPSRKQDSPEGEE